MIFFPGPLTARVRIALLLSLVVFKAGLRRSEYRDFYRQQKTREDSFHEAFSAYESSRYFSFAGGRKTSFTNAISCVLADRSARDGIFKGNPDGRIASSISGTGETTLRRRDRVDSGIDGLLN